MQRSAASFNASNTSLEKATALVTATNTVLQDEEKVGNMWKTVSARLRGASTELTEMGEDTDNLVTSTSKLRDTIKSMTGFDIMKDENTYKDIYDIVVGIGEKWNDLSDINRASLLETLAGKNQSNALAAALSNIDVLKKSYKEAMTADGSAMKEQQKYQESIQYSIDQTKAKLEELANNTLSSGFLKGTIDSSGKLLDILDKIAEHTNLLQMAFAGLGIFAGVTNSGIVTSGNEALAKKGAYLNNNFKDFFGGIAGNISSLFKKQTLYSDSDTEKLTNFINRYNELKQSANNPADLVAARSTAYVETLSEASEEAKKLARSTDGAKLSINNLYKASVAAEVGMRALSVALNAAASIAFTWAITKAYEAVDNYVHAQEYAMEASKNLTDTYTSEKSSLEENIAQYEELGKKLDDTSLSAEELQSVKQQLSSVQDSLNKKYGYEATQIDLVNGKYDEQIAKLDELAKKKAANFVADNAKNIKSDDAYVNDVYSNSIEIGAKGTIADANDPKKIGFDLQKYLDKYDNLKVNSWADWENQANSSLYIQTFGTRAENVEALRSLSNDLLEAYGTSNEIVNQFRENISQALNEDYDTTKISEATENLKAYAQANIDMSDEASFAVDDFNAAITVYNDAVRNGADTTDAKKDLLEKKEVLEDAVSSIGNVDLVLEDMFKTLTPDAPVELKIKFTGEDGQDLQDAYDSTINRFKTGLPTEIPVVDNVPDTTETKDNFLEQKEIVEDTVDTIKDSAPVLEDMFKTLTPDAPVELKIKFTGEDGQDLQDEWKLPIKPVVSAESDKGEFTEAAKNLLEQKDLYEQLETEYKKIDDWGLSKYKDQIINGTLPSQFGNIDMDNRQIISWNKDTLEQYKDALQDIFITDENGEIIRYYDELANNIQNGWESIDSVLGGSMEDIKGYKGITDIAFSHIVNDDDGAVKVLGEKTAQEYIYGILDVAKKDGDLSIDHILELDKQGYDAAVYNAEGQKIGEEYIHGIISGFNDEALDVGGLMHFAGDSGAINIIKNQLAGLRQKYDIDDQTQIKNFLDKAGINTVEKLQEFNDFTKGIDNAAEAIQKWNSMSINSGFDIKSTDEMATFKTKIDEAVTSYNNLNTAILAQETGKSVSMTDDLKKYADCLEYTNGVMQINIEQAREKAQASTDESLATIEANAAQERYQYTLNQNKIRLYTEALGDKNSVEVDGITITRNMLETLKDNNSQIVSNAKNYALMASQIRQATGSYQAWLDAQNSSDQGTMFTDAGNAAKAISEGLANGKIGTEKFKAAVEFIMPDSIDSENEAKVKEYLTKVQRYLADNGTGVNNFIADAITNGLMESLDGNSATLVKGTTIKDFVDKLGITEEVARAMFGEMETYGWDFDWGEGFDSLDEALFAAQSQYDELKNSLEEQGFNVDVDDAQLRALSDDLNQIGGQIDELTQKVYNSVTSIKSNADFNTLQQDLEELNALKQQFDNAKISGTNTTELEQALQALTSQLSEKYNLNLDSSDAEGVLKNLQNQMINISGLTSYTLSIADSEAKKKLADLKNQLSDINAQIDELSNKKIQNSLDARESTLKGNTKAQLYAKIKNDAIDKQLASLLKQREELESQVESQQEVVDWIASVKLDLDMESVDAVTQAKTEIEQNPVKIQVDQTQIDSAKRGLEQVKTLIKQINDLSVNLKTPGLPTSLPVSSSSADGHAKAFGSNDIGSAQTALVGELGREIVVDPANGTWRTYGDNGAEFVDLPPHAIVFNHKQTEGLLKRGFVNERGTALAYGNAFAGGTYSGTNNTFSGFGKRYVPISGDDSLKSTQESADKAAKATDNLTNSTKNAADAESNLVDWIDRRITLLDNQASLLAKKSSDAYMSYFGMTEEQFESISSLMSDPTNVENYGEGLKQLSEISQTTGKSMDELYETIKSGNFEESRLSANAAQLEINAEKINTLTAAVEQYRAKYEEYMATISQDYRSKIESGALTLENFESETSSDDNSSQNSSLYDNIQKAIEYYDKVKSSETSLYDTQQEHLTLLEEKHDLYIGKLEKENTLLQTQADLTQKSIDLATAVGEIVSADSYESLISNNKQQQSNIRKQISAKQDKLDELDPEVDTEEYYTLENEILEAKGNLLDLKKAQAEYNKKLKEMPITNMSTIISMYKDISTAIQNWGAEIEATGTALTADYYQELIKNGSTIVSEYQKQAGIIQDVMDTYDVGSDNWNELYSQLQSVNSEMSSMIQNLKKWNEELLQLPLTKITNYSSDLTKVKDALTELQDDYTTVISVVTSAIEDETKAIQDQQEEYQKAIKEQTDALQDKIDLLEKQNTKLQLQQSLEQALYDLQTANTQKTEKVSILPSSTVM